jgi:hypothetical protein
VIVAEAVPARAPMNRWTAWSFAYGALVVFGMGCFLLDLPIQVSDSYGNLVQASSGSFADLVSQQFHTRAFLRPLLWAHIRLVHDLSGGHYYEWFRGWHVGQFAVLTVLFLRLVRPMRLVDAAAIPIGLAALVGMHTFAGTVREAFPINTFMTILICCYLAADLALGPWRWWHDVAAALLFTFAVLSVESGMLVAVVFVAAFAAGARGVSRRGLTAVVALVAGYLVLRFVILHVGTPELNERSSGFGFSTREPDELAAMFGGSVIPFYLYNVVSSFLSVLFSEPRAGIWVATRGLVEGSLTPAPLVNVTASTIATFVIGGYVWSRRAEWRARRFNRGDQLTIVFGAVLVANAAISYAYTKDVILSPAGAFFACALTAATAHLIDGACRATTGRRLLVSAALVVLSSTWALRAIGEHAGIRKSAANVRNEWAIVDEWLEREHLVPTTTSAIELERRLRTDAIWTHPARPVVTGDWVEWLSDD